MSPYKKIGESSALVLSRLIPQLFSTVLLLLSSTVTADNAQAAPPAISVTDVRQLETLQEKADRIALEQRISSSTLSNLVSGESSWNPTAVSPTGDYGLVQINLEQPPVLSKDQPPITVEEAFDPDFALTFAAKAIAQGKESAWSICNCYSYIKTRFPAGVVPLMNQITPNTEIATGTVAIFYYGEVEHLAYITSLHTDYFTVDETNYSPCLHAKREVQYNDPHLIGFWSP